MAFNQAPPRAEYIASAGQTIFPFTFKIFTETDIEVYQTLSGSEANDTNDILALNTEYSVVIDGDNGGTITLVTPASVSDSLTLVRELPIDRDVDYQTSGDLLATTLNQDQNYQTYLTSDQQSNANRHISIPKSAQNVSTDLPDVVSDSYLKWNTAGTALENDTTIPDAVTDSAANAAAAATSESNAATSETNASNSASNAATSETNAAASAASIDPASLVNLSATQIIDGYKTFRQNLANLATKLKWNVDNTLLLSNIEQTTGSTTKLVLNTSADGFNNGAIIWVEGAGAFNSGELVFGTGWDASSNATEWMRIKADGVVNFVKPPTVPTPVGANDVANKDYVDNGSHISAWVNFDGLATPPTIRDSINVSAVNRVSTGKFQIVFTTPLANANYSITTGKQAWTDFSESIDILTGQLTTSFEILNRSDLGTGRDTPLINLHILGGK